MKIVRFSQLFATEESDDRPSQKKKTTEPAEKRGTNLNSPRVLCEENSRAKENEGQNGQSVAFLRIVSCIFCIFIAAKLDWTVSNTLPGGCFCLPIRVAHVDKECPADIRKARNVCPDGTILNYNAIWSFLGAVMSPWDVDPTYIEKGRCIVSFLDCLKVRMCRNVEWAGYDILGEKDLAYSW